MLRRYPFLYMGVCTADYQLNINWLLQADLKKRGILCFTNINTSLLGEGIASE